MLAADPLDPAVASVCSTALLDRREQGGVGVGVPERLAGRIDQRHATLRAAGTAPARRSALSLPAMNSPNATFSSAVVRISVTSGLCTWSTAVGELRGHASRGRRS